MATLIYHIHSILQSIHLHVLILGTVIFQTNDKEDEACDSIWGLSLNFMVSYQKQLVFNSFCVSANQIPSSHHVDLKD